MKEKDTSLNTSQSSVAHKVGLFGLITIVVGSMLGGGIFNLPQEMASNGGVAASVIAWVITGIGVYFIAKVFQILSYDEPDITGGIYYYAKNGFGSYIGFNSAWGYWLSNVIGNISFAILFVDALAKFIPAVGSSYTVPGIIISTILIWAVVFLVAKGMKTATMLNNIATVAKILPIIIAIFLLIVSFKQGIFTQDIWAKALNAKGAGLGDVSNQVKNCMLQTLWVFIGVEGAVVISGRAKSSKDVGKATIIGYLAVLLCYILIVMLSFGSVDQSTLMHMKTPSLGGVLEYVVGNWASIMIDLGVIISVLGAWVSWTILTAEIPMTVAQDKMFPKFLGKSNENHAAINALIFNAAIMQICYFVTLFANNAFQAVTDTATTMVLVPYVLSAAFLIKLGIKKHKNVNIFYGVGGVVYGLYMIYSSGVKSILYCIALYAIGIIFLAIKSREQNTPLFEKTWEKYLCIAISIIGICSIIFI